MLPSEKRRGLSLRQRWTALTWTERLAAAIGATNLLAAIGLAALFAFVGTALFLFPDKAQGWDRLLIAPLALLAGVVLLGLATVLGMLVALQVLNLALVLSRQPVGHVLLAAVLVGSGLFLVQMDDKDLVALRLSVGSLWFAGAAFSVASLVRRRPR